MKFNGKVVQKLVVSKRKGGVQVRLMGLAGRGSPYALGELRSDGGTPGELVRVAVASGQLIENPKTP